MTISGVLEEEVGRMVHAVTIGLIADRMFARACQLAGIDPAFAMTAPLDTLSMAQIKAEGRA